MLSKAWFSDGSNPWDSFDTGVDLARMLMEDDEPDELERVIAQWRRSVAMYPGLLRNHPKLASGLRRGALHERLTRACC